MAEIDKLFVSVGADIKGFLTGMSAVGKHTAGLQSKLSAMGGQLTKFVTLPLIGVGVAAVASAMSVEKGLNAIRIGTGKTGEELEGLQDIMRDVAKTVPQGFEEVGTAVADLNTRLGLTGEELETMTKKMLDLARITETDVSTVIRDMTRVFGDWGVATEDQSEVMDYLYRTTQETGISISTLSEKMVQSGAPLRGLGFDLETAAAMMGKFEKEGVNTDTLLGSLKIGFARMAREGVTDAKEAFKLLIKEIKDAPGDMDATAIALEIFGSRACADFALAVREDRFDFEDLMTTLSNGTDTIEGTAEDTETLAMKFDELKNRVVLALEPIGIKLMDALEKLIPVFEKVVGWVSKLIEGFANLPGPVQNAILIMGGIALLAGPVMKLTAAVIGLSGAIGGLSFTSAIAVGSIGLLEAALLAASAAAGYFIGKEISKPVVTMIHDAADFESKAQSLVNMLEKWGGTGEDLAKTMHELGYAGEDVVFAYDEAFARIVQTGELAAAQLTMLPQEIAVALESEVGYFRSAGELGMKKYIDGIISQTGRSEDEAKEISAVIRDGLSSEDEAIRANAQGMMQTIMDELVAGGALLQPQADAIMAGVTGALAQAPPLDMWWNWKDKLLAVFGQVQSAANTTAAVLAGVGTTTSTGHGGAYTETGEGHQAGGLFTHPHYAMVAEVEPEIIVPLSNLDSFARGLASTGIGGNGVSIAGNLILDFPNVTNEFNAKGVTRQISAEIAGSAIHYGAVMG